jgi:hypothetical protein
LWRLPTEQKEARSLTPHSARLGDGAIKFLLLLGNRLLVSLDLFKPRGIAGTIKRGELAFQPDTSLALVLKHALGLCGRNGNRHHCRKPKLSDQSRNHRYSAFIASGRAQKSADTIREKAVAMQVLERDEKD